MLLTHAGNACLDWLDSEIAGGRCLKMPQMSDVERADLEMEAGRRMSDTQAYMYQRRQIAAHEIDTLLARTVAGGR